LPSLQAEGGEKEKILIKRGRQPLFAQGAGEEAGEGSASTDRREKKREKKKNKKKKKGSPSTKNGEKEKGKNVFFRFPRGKETKVRKKGARVAFSKERSEEVFCTGGGEKEKNPK